MRKNTTQYQKRNKTRQRETEEKIAEHTVFRIAITGICLAISAYLTHGVYLTYKYETAPVQGIIMGYRLDPGGPDGSDKYHLRLRIKPPAPYTDSLLLETTDNISPSDRRHYHIGSPATATFLFTPKPRVLLCLKNYQKNRIVGILFLGLVMAMVWMRIKPEPEA